MGYDYQIYQTLQRIEALLKAFFGNNKFSDIITAFSNFDTFVTSNWSYIRYGAYFIGIFFFVWLGWKVFYVRSKTL